MKKSKLLIVDDNPGILSALNLLLKSEFDVIKTISNPNQLYTELDRNDIDVVLLDMNFKAGVNSGNEGLFWLREIRKKSLRIQVIMITAYGDVELAVKSLREGAFDFVLKPWDNNKLKASLKSASGMKTLISESPGPKPMKGDFGIIKGKSIAMEEVMILINKIAATDANVLITGENGTGKELVAKEIHNLSRRTDGAFVMVDLSSLTETIFESELFGHKKGAFTNACEDKTGKFMLADKGTLFLDEIGNIPLNLQAKILTVLQTRIITPVGSNKELPVDFRLLSATNRNLTEMVKDNQFRQDLLYRMNTIRIHLPPLRERLEDIDELARHFLKIYSGKYNKPDLELKEDAIQKLKKNLWPGNIRELQHTIEKAVILAEGDRIRPSDFLFMENDMTMMNEAETLEEMERKMIISTLKKNNNSQTITAEQLGITRQTLYNKIKKYGI